MNGTVGKTPDPDDPESGAEEAIEAAAEVLHPAIPPAGAAILIEADPRLHRPSETEEELKELVESNEAAERDAAEKAGVKR
jgi:hypothetical protein